ncbi:MAG: hypothetical protein KC503_22465 [Myxococcales bacterium]|nr:hypothetical protein [Myxococcales bacterium]
MRSLRRAMALGCAAASCLVASVCHGHAGAHGASAGLPRLVGKRGTAFALETSRFDLDGVRGTNVALVISAWWTLRGAWLASLSGPLALTKIEGTATRVGTGEISGSIAYRLLYDDLKRLSLMLSYRTPPTLQSSEGWSAGTLVGRAILALDDGRWAMTVFAGFLGVIGTGGVPRFLQPHSTAELLGGLRLRAPLPLGLFVGLGSELRVVVATSARGRMLATLSPRVGWRPAPGLQIELVGAAPVTPARRQDWGARARVIASY